MSGQHNKVERRLIRHRRVRQRVIGTPQRPRLAVFRSAQHIYVQVIDDAAGRTLAAASSRESIPAPTEGKAKVGKSFSVGKLIAERAKGAGVTKVCFDRGGYLYHGRVKALAEGARSGGLEF